MLLARAVFDAADPFVAIAGRDLRFGAIMCGRVAEGVRGFWSRFSIIPSAAMLPVLAGFLQASFQGRLVSITAAARAPCVRPLMRFT